MRRTFCLAVFLGIVLALNAHGAKQKKADAIDDTIIKEVEKQDLKIVIPAKMRENMREIKKCYSDELAKNKNLKKGLIKVNFTINKKGVPKMINIKSSDVDNKNVEKCVAKVIASIVFPLNPEDEIEVNYPIHIF